MQKALFFRFLFQWLISLGLTGICFSQEKIEKEVSVKSQDVPAPARQWLDDAFEKIQKPKWFLEYSQNGKSFEAKFQYRSQYYSVEFDSLGIVQDVEIEIDRSEIDPVVWKEISNYFDSAFQQVKVEKIQRQFSGSPEDLEDYFDEGENGNLRVNYEIVFQGKKELWELWEALFDESGQFLSILKVQIRLADNLVF